MRCDTDSGGAKLLNAKGPHNVLRGVVRFARGRVWYCNSVPILLYYLVFIHFEFFFLCFSLFTSTAAVKSLLVVPGISVRPAPQGGNVLLKQRKTPLC